nr:cytidine deaminase [Alicyclobacillus cycloheptanicus]
MEAAREARACAYVPYSRFAVGAALQLEDGRIITGANIENASYGLTNCAERTAVFRALMENGGKPLKVRAIAVIADSDGPVAPCGACRQVLAEFCAPETPVWLGDLAGGVKPTTVEGLLPYAFGPGQMHADSASDAASPADA